MTRFRSVNKFVSVVFPGKTIMLFFVCGTLLLYGCGCISVDCGSTGIYFNVVDKSGKNVFSEPDPTFDYSAVTISCISQTGTRLVYRPHSYDSLEVGFNLSPDVEEYIIQYSSTEADTVRLQPLARDTKCCGMMVETFDDLTVNGLAICSPCNDSVYTIVR